MTSEPDDQRDVQPDAQPDDRPDVQPDVQAVTAPDSGGYARETDVQESDPNADSAEGLAGGMGVSSEIVGDLRGSHEPGTYGTEETHVPLPDGELPPEWAPGGPDVQPDQPPVKQQHAQQGE
jgi:hypothetical protein